MKTVFLGERTQSMDGSGLSGAYLQTPPSELRIIETLQRDEAILGEACRVDGWVEIWDYAGGASFRAFVVGDDAERSLFVFFDVEGVAGRDLKKA